MKTAFRRPVVWGRHLGLHATDVFVAEYPKSGSTWFSFMLAEVAFGEEVDFDNQGVFIPGVGQHARARRLGSETRLLRTHERFRPDYARAVYIVRHVADVLVSYFHWYQWFSGRRTPLDVFVSRFLTGKLDGYGRWDRHVASWLDAIETKAADGIVIRYEDLRDDPTASLRRAIEFLDIAAGDDVLRRVVQNNSLERMRQKQERSRETVFRGRAVSGSFVRSGKSGEWRSVLTEQTIEAMRARMGPTAGRLGYSIEP